MKLFYLVSAFAALALAVVALHLASVSQHPTAEVVPTAAAAPKAQAEIPGEVGGPYTIVAAVLNGSWAQICQTSNGTLRLYLLKIGNYTAYLYAPAGALNETRVFMEISAGPASAAPSTEPSAWATPRLEAAGALGAASGALLALAIYTAACGGRVCKARRLRGLAYASASSLAAATASALVAGPSMLALAAPGAIGLYRYIKARRRIAAWLSTTLT
ncbi:MAG: hypothetical protein ACP5KY_08835 [Thermoproteus sp.]